MIRGSYTPRAPFKVHGGVTSLKSSDIGRAVWVRFRLGEGLPDSRLSCKSVRNLTCVAGISCQSENWSTQAPSGYQKGRAQNWSHMPYPCRMPIWQVYEPRKTVLNHIEPQGPLYIPVVYQIPNEGPYFKANSNKDAQGLRTQIRSPDFEAMSVWCD